jgi:hypothetical protein
MWGWAREPYPFLPEARRKVLAPFRPVQNEVSVAASARSVLRSRPGSTRGATDRLIPSPPLAGARAAPALYGGRAVRCRRPRSPPSRKAAPQPPPGSGRHSRDPDPQGHRATRRPSHTASLPLGVPPARLPSSPAFPGAPPPRPPPLASPAPWRIGFGRRTRASGRLARSRAAFRDVLGASRT